MAISAAGDFKLMSLDRRAECTSRGELAEERGTFEFRARWARTSWVVNELTWFAGCVRHGGGIGADLTLPVIQDGRQTPRPGGPAQGKGSSGKRTVSAAGRL
jgi:hypothetical protein